MDIFVPFLAISWNIVLILFLIGFTVSTIGALIPVRRLSRMNPVDAIKKV
jgi:ABC-type antimicrobial peptide transport system permease subunit